MLWSGYVFSLMLVDTDVQFNSTSNQTTDSKYLNSLKSYNILNGCTSFGSYCSTMLELIAGSGLGWSCH